MKILILSSYTTRQKYQPANFLQCEDCNSRERLQWRLKELRGYNAEGWYHEDKDYSAPAGEMFTGPLHTQLREGLKQIREHGQYGETTLDLYFPWYACRVDGKKTPVSENDIIVPFDIAPLHNLEVLEYGETGVPESMADLIESYDLVFSLLRQDDITSLRRVFEVERAVTLIFLLAPSHKHVVDESLPDVHVVETGSKLGKAIGATNWALKGVVLRRLCEAASRDGFHIFEQVKQNPSGCWKSYRIKAEIWSFRYFYQVFMSCFLKTSLISVISCSMQLTKKCVMIALGGSPSGAACL